MVRRRTGHAQPNGDSDTNRNPEPKCHSLHANRDQDSHTHRYTRGDADSHRYAYQHKDSCGRHPNAHRNVSTDRGARGGLLASMDGDEVSGLALHDSILWAAPTGGAVRWDTVSGTHTKYVAPDGLSENSTKAVSIHASGTVWLGTWGGGIAAFDGIS